MFIRVRLLAAFPSEPPPGWLNAIKALFLANAITINPGQPHSEPSTYIVEECYHDEDPNLPCQIIDHEETAP